MRRVYECVISRYYCPGTRFRAFHSEQRWRCYREGTQTQAGQISALAVADRALGSEIATLRPLSFRTGALGLVVDELGQRPACFLDDPHVAVFILEGCLVERGIEPCVVRFLAVGEYRAQAGETANDLVRAVNLARCEILQ